MAERRKAETLVEESRNANPPDDFMGEKQVTVVKRDGKVVPFRRERIQHAIEAAFRDTRKIESVVPLPAEISQIVLEVTDLVTTQLLEMASKGTTLTVEGIQDLVEVTLMRCGFHDVARDYIVYRDKHKALRTDSPRNLRIQRSDGSFARFNPMKVAAAIEEAFRRTRTFEGPASEEIVAAVNLLTQKTVDRAMELARAGEALTSMRLQDEVELQLMQAGFFDVAKESILYRSTKSAELEAAMTAEADRAVEVRAFTVARPDGTSFLLSMSEIRSKVAYACRGLEHEVKIDELIESSITNFYEGIKEAEVDLSHILAARAMIEREPSYGKVAGRLLLDLLYRETMGMEASNADLTKRHKTYFKEFLKRGVELERIDSRLLEYDLETLGSAMNLSRDEKFEYHGLQTLYDRYFIHDRGRRVETPQIFWMRIAMGLALSEKREERTKRTIEFYNVLSTFLFTSSTPTLFNSGTCHPQLSSCYLSTVMDDLGHIFKLIADNAQLSKWAGGIGNDWTNVRASGAMIKGTNGKSQGVIPFLKVANDTAVAVNQGGKRKGVACAYLETWHLDIEDFSELRKNTGDERRRTHDMNTANWIPDLFMKRVQENGSWTLFSPSDVPDLHHLYGVAFEKRYCEYERMTESGKITLFKKIEAVQLWRKILSMLFETGHPWITFKDPSNIRSPQDHAGVVHSSNLCTEILLNTSAEETAVCNLGSISLVEHMRDGKLDEELLASTVRSAVRMLDNVIDINFYPTIEARAANTRHRPIGMGIMGFQDALYIQGISYASPEAVEFADSSMELISYFAILASSELAKERGPYSSYKGSKWDRGLLPIDTIDLLEKERGGNVDVDRSSRRDWSIVRNAIRKHGMRNSNTMAIAPTATISNITDVTQSIEPMYKHLFVKSNLSGEFTVVNTYLVGKLKELGLWDAKMLDDLKYFDGSIHEIERIPQELRKLFPTAFEIAPEWLIECASRRQKWIDMGQSLNLYLAQPSGKKLHQMYMLAWTKGLKTTYYLRSLGATQIEKSTTDINARGLQPRWMKERSPSADVQVHREEAAAPKACRIDDPTCESCQ